MSRKRSYHVVPHEKGWCLKKSGASRATACFKTQQETINAGKKACVNQKTELFIHNKQGQFRERNSYGNDPFPPLG